jgi:iron complex outermembrane receptor protein
MRPQRAIAAAVIAATTLPAFAQEGAVRQGLEEIIVTAQKREQGLQDVPISVQAFDRQSIDNLGAQDIGDLGIFTPNVDIGRGANQPRYAIRGIGTNDFGIGSDPAVGVYVDGVYIGRSGGSKTAFNDIQRVEILNGPQGTLFGRNAAAGAIQYVTNKPVDGYEGWVRGTVGDYDRYQLEGVYNMPLADNLYWRTSVLWNQRDGFIDNDYNGDELAEEDNWSITSTLLWEPSDRLQVWWRMEYDEVDQDSRPASSAVLGPRDNKGADFENVETEEKLDETRDLFGTSLHLTFEMEYATFTSITAYREYDTENPEEQDGSADPLYRFTDYNAEDNNQWSQEFRFNGDLGDKFTWLVGANYNKENAEQTSGIQLSTVAVDKLVVEREIGIPYELVSPGFGFTAAFLAGFPDLPRIYETGEEALAAGTYSEWIDVDGEYESWAVFGDVTYSILENLDITAGIRYTEDDKEFGRNVKYNDFGMWFAFDETRIDEQGNLVGYPEGRQGWFYQDEDWDDTTGRLVLDWRVLDDVLLYASWAEGYKAGGFNSVGDRNDDPPFDPEEVTTWEVGIKSSWFDNTLRFNAAYFDYEYDNLQELEFVDGACLGRQFGSHQFLTSDVEGDGYELSINWLATPGLELWANAGSVDADVVEKDRCEEINGEPVVQDKSGEKFADDFSYSLGANYSYDFANGSAANLAVAWAWKEGAGDRTSCTYVETLADGSGAVYGLTEVEGNLIISDPSATGTLTEPPFSSCPDLDDEERLNARLSWTDPSGNWEVGAWITNATDWGPDGDAGGNGGELSSDVTDGSPAYSRREEPRMWGMDLKYTFR